MRVIGRLILGAIFIALTAALIYAATYMPGFFLFYAPLQKQAAAYLAGIFAPFPFPVWQAALGIVLLVIVYALVRVFTKKKGFFRWVTGVAAFLCAAVFVFTALWGVCHWAKPVNEQLGIPVSPYSLAELEAATRFFAQEASGLSTEVDRTVNGDMRVDFTAFGETAGKAFEPLAAEFPIFEGSNAPVKTLLLDDAFRYMGITGIYVPFTGEASVSRGTYAASVPHTMCHEAAHRLGFAGEDEANFCAFLACRLSDDIAFRYSGHYSAFITCYNALQKADPSAAKAVWEGLSEEMVSDLRNANEHYGKYEGKVQDAAQKANDTYLKAYGQEEGVQSYGQADLYVAWYLAR